MHKMTWPKVNDDHGMLMKMTMLILCMWKDAAITLGCYSGTLIREVEPNWPPGLGGHRALSPVGPFLQGGAFGVF